MLSDFVDPVCMKYMEIFLRGSFQGIFHAIEFQRDDLLKAEWLMMFLIYFYRKELRAVDKKCKMKGTLSSNVLRQYNDTFMKTNYN